MYEYPGDWHVLDQDESVFDDHGRPWPMRDVPPQTAAEILEWSRQNAPTLLAKYTLVQHEYAQSARRYGHDVPLDYEPDSTPFFDAMTEAEFTKGAKASEAERRALALQWLDAKPFMRALEARSHGQEP